MPDLNADSAPDAKSLTTSRHLANVGVFCVFTHREVKIFTPFSLANFLASDSVMFLPILSKIPVV